MAGKIGPGMKAGEALKAWQAAENLPEGTAIEVFAPGGDVENSRDAIGTPLVIKATLVIQEGD